MHDKTLRIIFCAALLFAIKTSGADKAISPIIHPELDWKRMDGEATREKIVTLSPDAKKERAKGSFKLSSQDGSSTIKPTILDPKLFIGTEIFAADLPKEVRKQGTFIRFLIQGTAKEDPEQGTILNLDGAILGFKARIRNGVPYAADLVAAVGSAKGKLIWEPVGMFIPIDLNSGLTTNPPLCVRMEWATNTWALLTNDIPLREGLPLFAEKGKSSIEIRAGAFLGDKVILKDIAYADRPSPRPNSPIKLNGHGELDLEAAFRAGVPDIQHAEGVSDKSRK